MIAARYPTRFLRSYVRSKIATDPVYEAVFDCLRGTSRPLLDVGCGIGILALYLRKHGFTGPIVGIDADAQKIAVARRVTESDGSICFRVADARSPFEFEGNVVLLDVLHYFDDGDQRTILDHASRSVAPGGMVIIRDAIKEGTLRYRLTYAAERFARLVRWLRVERLNFPTRSTIESGFPLEMFERQTRAMWGRTPFNNYLFVFRRSFAGITNE
jgi:2-polyprenyl-3-methyl-5-hydroxy-6-metoxy-1,4-benzoquinol methylase